jgi:hypothetical protein
VWRRLHPVKTVRPWTLVYAWEDRVRYAVHGSAGEQWEQGGEGHRQDSSRQSASRHGPGSHDTGSQGGWQREQERRAEEDVRWRERDNEEIVAAHIKKTRVRIILGVAVTLVAIALWVCLRLLT